MFFHWFIAYTPMSFITSYGQEMLNPNIDLLLCTVYLGTNSIYLRHTFC